MHLRYLWLSEPDKSFFEISFPLYHLQALTLGSFYWFRRCHFFSLSNLTKSCRLAYVSGSFLLDLERTDTKLAELNGCDILYGELQILHLENIESKEEAERAELHRKQHIGSLLFKWSTPQGTIVRGIKNSDLAKDVLNGLQPHRNLKRLTIENFPDKQLPEWMENGLLYRLSKLNLSSCKKLTVLHLGYLPCLKELLIADMQNVKKVEFRHSQDMIKGFRLLTTLSFSHMKKWSEWKLEGEQDKIFPSLQYLSIESCPELAYLPCTSFPSMKCLYVQDAAGLHSFKLKALSFPRQSVCFHLESCSLLSKTVSCLHVDLVRAIEDIKISYCSKTEHIQTEGFSNLTSLRSLEVEYCPNLLTDCISRSESMKNELDEDNSILPSSLESLSFLNCCIASDWLSRGLMGLKSLSKLEIKCCEDLTSFPESKILQHLTSLRELVVSRIDELQSIGRLSTLVSLERLEIASCSRLRSLAAEGLPSSIQSLSLECCEELRSLGRLDGLSCLTHLQIIRCPRLMPLEEGFPASIQSLTLEDYTDLKSFERLQNMHALKSLRVIGCKELESFKGSEAFFSLQECEISNCHRLKLLERLPPFIESLLIEKCLELLSLGSMHNLHSLRTMTIRKCPKLNSLIGKSLPASITDLTIDDCQEISSIGRLDNAHSLKTMRLRYCPKLKLLPLTKLPASITDLHIWKCHPELMKQLLEKYEWHKTLQQRSLCSAQAANEGTSARQLKRLHNLRISSI